MLKAVYSNYPGAFVAGTSQHPVHCVENARTRAEECRAWWGKSGNDIKKIKWNRDGGAMTPTNQVTKLEGTWRKQCGPVEGDEHHDIVTVTFTRRGEFTTSIENYTNTSCTVPFDMAPNPTSSGTFTLGGDVLVSDGATAIELDSHVTQFDGAPFDINDYTIVYINNDSLYLGEGEADSPQERPTSLDYDRPFYRLN